VGPHGSAEEEQAGDGQEGHDVHGTNNT
jgi:hypothetical protein